MPQLNASNGKCVMAGQADTTGTAATFITSAVQIYLVTVTASAGYVKLSLRVGADNVFQGDFTQFVTPFDTDIATTATALVTLITNDADFSTVAISDLTDGSFIIESQTVTSNIQVKGEFGCTTLRQRESFDLSTYEGDAYLLAKVSGGNIRYTENPIVTVSPTTAVGELVEDGGWFDIIGKDNIIRTQFIEETASAVIDYQIYVA
jgi:hypothetical protein